MKLPVAVLGAILALALASCSNDDNGAMYQGYVEGDFLLIGPKATGQLATLDVQAGDRVEKGAALFTLDPFEAAARKQQAEARLKQAQAQLDNLLKGKRPLELAVIEAQINEAEARLNVAETNYNRAKNLRESRVIPQSQLDDAKMSRDVAQAELARLKYELEAARLPARGDEIEAARRHVDAARAQLEEAQIRLNDFKLVAPQTGLVQEVFYREGEVVPAGRSVVSLLPPQNRKVRFFVPEADLAKARMGDEVAVGCDNCPPGLKARITFISDEAEFTPPVIFSVQARAKLVYKIEAIPERDGSALKPGQPVDVTLLVENR